MLILLYIPNYFLKDFELLRYYLLQQLLSCYNYLFIAIYKDNTKIKINIPKLIGKL